MRMEGAMLFVKDLGEMTAFYRDVIGLRPIEETRREDWIEFDAGGARFALHAIPRNIAEILETTAPPSAREEQSHKLIFAADDADAEKERLAAAGVTILERPWGGWDVVDPEGNVLGVRASGG